MFGRSVSRFVARRRRSSSWTAPASSAPSRAPGLIASWAFLALLGAATPSAAQEVPTPLSLTELVREALERNPEVQMAARAVESKRARVGQAGALPDPMVMYGVINEGRPVPFQTLGERDFSEVYVGVSQEFPNGKRGLRTQAAQEEAAAEEAAYEAVRRKVVADVAEAYYDLYAVYAGVDVVEQNRQLLEQFAKVASTRFSVGQATQQDVLDAEAEVSRLEERRSQLEERRAVGEARLASLLFKGSSTAWGRPGTITETALSERLEELLVRAEQQSPILHSKDRLVARGERKLNLAQRDKRPDLSFNFVYHNRGGLDPYYTFGGTVTLPNLHGKQTRAVEEAAADLAGSRTGTDAARADVRYAVTEAYQRATTTTRLLRLYDDGILKQARLSLDSAMAQYRVGRVDFLTLITSWRRLLDYDLMYQEQLAEHEKALARLAVHVGPPAGAAQ
jgi:cobalt-zinc-cadmium efflux system outer membrane protein